MRIFFILFFIALSQVGCGSKKPERPVLRTAGWLEMVEVGQNQLKLNAKLDTGADSCSLHAEDMIFYKDKKSPRIKFTISNRYGAKEEIDTEVVRYTKIKTKDGDSQVRPVVEIGVCLGRNYESVECNLVDRSHFEYPALVGRNLLAGKFVINSSATYITEPSCSKNKKKK